ncbi:MAG: zinc-binding alcohol dehydrogenase [Myxococcota bacterium]
MNARAFWVEAPHRGAIRAASLPTPGPDEVLVETLYSGISRGTELLVYRGGVPQNQRDAMRCPFQEGSFPGPVKYGYINVGRTVDGQRVFCLFPHQDRYVVPRDALVPLPDGVPARRAVLTANLETAINGVWDATPGPGDRIGVIGAGVVGSLIAWLCGQIPGADVQLIDINPLREPVARALGVEFAVAGRARGELDLVIHASGSPAGLSEALALAGVEAAIVEMSWFGDRAVSLPLGESFHSRRLTIRSSQVGRIPPERTARWDYRRRLMLALSLLQDDCLDVLINEESRFEDLPRTLNRLASHPNGTLCHCVRYPAADIFEE